MGKERRVRQGRSVSMESALLLYILFTLPDHSWKKVYINRVSEVVISTSAPRQKYLIGHSHSPEPSMFPWGQERCGLNRERSSCLLWQEKGMQSNGHKKINSVDKKYLETSSYWVNTRKNPNTLNILPFKLVFTNAFKIFFFTAILLFLSNSHIFLLDNSYIQLFLFHSSFITFLKPNHQTAEIRPFDRLRLHFFRCSLLIDL